MMITDEAKKTIKGLKEKRFYGPPRSGRTTRARRWAEENNVSVIGTDEQQDCDVLYYTKP